MPRIAREERGYKKAGFFQLASMSHFFFLFVRCTSEISESLFCILVAVRWSCRAQKRNQRCQFITLSATACLWNPKAKCFDSAVKETRRKLSRHQSQAIWACYLLCLSLPLFPLLCDSWIILWHTQTHQAQLTHAQYCFTIVKMYIYRNNKWVKN